MVWLRSNPVSCLVKFCFSEKHTKFEKKLPRGFEKSADLLRKHQNHEEDFFKLCVLLEKLKYPKLIHSSMMASKVWIPNKQTKSDNNASPEIVLLQSTS